MVDVVLVLITLKVIALIFEDVVAAARGKTSPRRQEREKRERVDRAAGREPKRTRSAIGKYFADLIEDASDAARERRPERWEQRRQRREERRAIYRERRTRGPVAIEYDRQAKHWYGNCDLCDWRSRPYQLKRNADDASKQHTDIHHTDTDEDPDTMPEPTRRPSPARRTKRPARSGSPQQLRPIPELESVPPKINEGSGA
jgi:hypothetical protein